MEKRRFGRTEHLSTVAIFGAVALGQIDQPAADKVMEQVVAAGINHYDVAPSYGDAELRLGPWMPKVRDSVFLGCKTTERTRQGAKAEMFESLKRLQVERFDLYQLHAVTTMQELDAVTGKDGALETFIEAREQGLTRYLGITGHGMQVAEIFLEALRRFDFDSVLFPINYKLFSIPAYREKAEELLQVCKAKDVGVMIIKSVAKGPWGEKTQRYHTWYEPFDDAEHIQKGINFALSQEVTGICTTGDYRVLPTVLEACEHYRKLSREEQDALIREGEALENMFEEA